MVKHGIIYISSIWIIFSFLKVNLKFQFYPQIKTDFPSTSWIIIMYEYNWYVWKIYSIHLGSYSTVEGTHKWMFSNRIESNGGSEGEAPREKMAIFVIGKEIFTVDLLITVR